MDQGVDNRQAGWRDEELAVSTVEPAILVSSMTEDAPTLTVATIVGLTIVVVIAIIIVFFLGVLIDCRQQRVMEKKMNQMRRFKSNRRANPHPDLDGVSIVNNMEEVGTSVPPIASLRTIP